MLGFAGVVNGAARQLLLPAVLGLASMAGLLAAFLCWSTAEADNVAAEHQRRIAATVLSQSITGIAHDQEGATIWDDSVNKVRARPLDMVWLDSNLGVWFHDYFGHDETYILDGADKAIYAMRGGYRVRPAMFDRNVAAHAAPIVAELRAAMGQRLSSSLKPTVLGPGAVQLGVVNGDPAIICAKPIVSDTGRVKQSGPEYVHISIRYLDRDFLTRLSSEYWFDRPRFAWTATTLEPDAYVALQSKRTGVIGYIAWHPFAPGAQVFDRLAPALVVTLLLVALIAAALLRRLSRRTMELQASEARAQHIAFHDTLTGLANRAHFEQRLDHELAGVRRSERGIALLFLDLDEFKSINDALGHPAGDALICELGRRLVATARESDTVARLGGDEFAIIQSGVSSAADVEILCLRIIEAVTAPFDLVGNQANIGISIGTAMAPRHAVDRVELTRKADIALYSAKTAGRGRFVMFDDVMDDTIRRRRAIEGELRAALADGSQFELLYQPVYAAQSRRMSGVEALVRWRHPKLGLMMPVTFIPVAEETGLIEPLGEWVLAEACAAARRWPIDTVAVNISAIQLRNPGFVERVINIVAASGLAPSRLELEITETSFLDNIDQCAASFAALRAHGIRIALDDFGTGYSSLSHLKLFDVDRLKIDRSFVHAIRHVGDKSPIIRAIVELAKASAIQVTAEGVETVEQEQFLAAIGCDMLQGYLLSRPLASTAIDAMIHHAEHMDHP